MEIISPPANVPANDARRNASITPWSGTRCGKRQDEFGWSNWRLLRSHQVRNNLVPINKYAHNRSSVSEKRSSSSGRFDTSDDVSRLLLWRHVA